MDESIDHHNDLGRPTEVVDTTEEPEDGWETASSVSSEESFYSCCSTDFHHPLELPKAGTGSGNVNSSHSSVSITFYDRPSASVDDTSPSSTYFLSTSTELEDSGEQTVFALTGGSDSEPEELSTRTGNLQKFLANMQRKVNEGIGIDVSKRLPSGVPIRVNVVGMLEPMCILFQTYEYAENVKSLKAQLKGFLLRKCEEEDIFEGAYVPIKYRNEFYRAQVEELSVYSDDYWYNECWVTLVDIGISVLTQQRDLYDLPRSMLKMNRQLVSVSMGDVRPTNEKTLFNYLQIHLVGKVLCLQLTHYYMDCHYYGLFLTVGVDTEGSSFSKTLIQQGLAKSANNVNRQAESLIKRHGEFHNYTASYLEVDEVTEDVYITHVVSPNDFYVRKRNSKDIYEQIQLALENAFNLGSFSGLYCRGQRMCIAPYNPITGKHHRCRAFCKEIDFTESTPFAKVYLIDDGVTGYVPLVDLKEYAIGLSTYPALALRVGIDAKSGENEEWPDDTTSSLKEIMRLSQKKRAEVQLTCVRKNTIKKKSYVRMKIDCCELEWTEALREIGEALLTTSLLRQDDVADVGALELDPITMPDSSFEFLEYKRKGFKTSSSSGYTDEGNVSKYSFSNTPPAVLPSIGDSLKINRMKGVYKYLVMTKQSYDLYQEIKKCSLDHVITGNGEPEDYQFAVGDVVLAPWNVKTYQRCCITDLEIRNGFKCATVIAFDTEQTQSFQVSRLKLPNEYLLKVEKLSHVVWLEETDENTLVFSQDLSKAIKPFFESVLPGNKLVVRLSITDSKGKTISLGKQVKEISRWEWKRYFNAGYLSQRRLLNKLYDVIPFSWDLNEFLNGGKYYDDEILRGFCKVQVRRVDTTQSPNFINLLAFPQIDRVLDDFRALRCQMDRFHEKVRYDDPLENSQTFPNIVALRDVREIKASCLAKRKLGSPCNWHRSIYVTEKNFFECVDCFQINYVSGCISNAHSLVETQGLDIREICPEMLKVPPLGKRLSVNLFHKDPFVSELIDNVLTLGKEIAVRIRKPVAHPTDDKHPPTLDADIPDIMNRLGSFVKTTPSNQKNNSTE